MPAGQESLLVEIEYRVAYTLHQGTPLWTKTILCLADDL